MLRPHYSCTTITLTVSDKRHNSPCGSASDLGSSTPNDCNDRVSPGTTPSPEEGLLGSPACLPPPNHSAATAGGGASSPSDVLSFFLAASAQARTSSSKSLSWVRNGILGEQPGNKRLHTKRPWICAHTSERHREKRVSLRERRERVITREHEIGARKPRP